MEAKKRREYEKEFKQRTVGLVKSGNRSVTEIARDLGIESRNIYRWVKEYNSDPQDSFPGKGKMKPEDEEVRKLKRQLADVTEERDILKKAISIFSKTKQ